MCLAVYVTLEFLSAINNFAGITVERNNAFGKYIENSGRLQMIFKNVLVFISVVLKFRTEYRLEN